MKKVIKKILIVLCLFGFIKSNAQDPIFSQIQNTLFTVNPALTGARALNNIIGINYRNLNIGNGTIINSTTAANYEHKFKKSTGNDYFAVGGNFISEQIGSGLLKKNSTTLSGAYYNSFSDDGASGLSLGLSLTYGNRLLDLEKVKTQDMFGSFGFLAATSTDPAAFDYSMNYFYTNVGIGYDVRLNEKDKFHIGAAIFKANRPRDSKSGEAKVAPRYAVESFYKKQINNEEELELIANHQILESNSITTVGVLYKKLLVDKEHLLELGLFNRVNDAIIPYVGMSLNNAKLGVSYDASISKHKNALSAQSSIELGFVWTWK